jgi:NAD(P)-dependent dehydrogenase (short-subunit alcohol dehydrogenase family)
MDNRRTDSHVLSGQRALVTGAHAGIGAAVASALAEAGATVVVNYAHYPRVDDVAQAIV